MQKTFPQEILLKKPMQSYLLSPKKSTFCGKIPD
jgi:hypothetical protein